MKKYIKRLICLLLMICVCTAFSACTEKKEEDKAVAKQIKTEKTVTSDGEENRQKVRIEFDGDEFEDIVVALYPEYAPDTVKRFVTLVEGGCYDGVEFGKRYSSSGIECNEIENLPKELNANIVGEFYENGITNDLKLEKGTLAMCRLDGEYNSASSKFMIILGDNDLDGKYAGFAKVVEGEDVVDKISKTAFDDNNKPVLPIVMKKVSVEE